MIKCGIIGYPIKKPRSVVLWKKYFLKEKINAEMLEFNFNKKNFNKNVYALLSEKNFLASAVTMPYKVDIKKYINYYNETAKLSGSVNLIVKHKKKIHGFNTDIYGFIKSLAKKILYKNIIILGMGGSGSAIYNYINKKYKKNFILVTKKKIKNTKNTKVISSLKSKHLNLTKKYLLINCTPLGSNLKNNFVKKTSISDEVIKKISKKSFIFDLVYKPKKTKLFFQCKRHKIPYKNGLEMNTYQGVKALKIVRKMTRFKLINV